MRTLEVKKVGQRSGFPNQDRTAFRLLTESEEAPFRVNLFFEFERTDSEETIKKFGECIIDLYGATDKTPKLEIGYDNDDFLRNIVRLMVSWFDKNGFDNIDESVSYIVTNTPTP